MMAHLGSFYNHQSFSNHQNLLVLIELNSSYFTSSISNERELFDGFSYGVVVVLHLK
jgi:hypothetical protein